MLLPRPVHRPTRAPLVRPRRGLALPFALLLLVVMSTLGAGAFIASRQSFRGGRNTMVEQRALAVAEFGLNSQVADWPTELPSARAKRSASTPSTLPSASTSPATNRRAE